MKRNLIILCCLAVSLRVLAAVPDADLDALYQRLDSLLQQKSHIIAEKEARIKVIRDALNDPTLSEEQQFMVNERLYNEYVAFRFDSALYYVQKNIDMQQRQNNTELHARSCIQLAHILSVSGIFNNARQLLFRIDPAQLSRDLRVDYYDQQGELNLFRSEMAVGTPYFADYIDSLQHYRKLILDTAQRDTYAYIFNTANYLCEQGQTDEAIMMLEHYLPVLHSGERRYSIVTSALSYFYMRQGRAAEREHYLLLSAISDEQGCILENNSLRELAVILMERGEFQKAYTYLSSASADARLYGSRLRSLQVSRLAPLITQAYDAERADHQRRTTRLLVLVTVIALLLVVMVAVVLYLHRKQASIARQMQQMNQRLEEQNHEIQQQSAIIQQHNHEMQEVSRIKDEYLGHFLDLNSTLIKRGQERSKLYNRLARDRKLDELYAELKSAKFLEENTRLFYQNFDEAFLNIYPNFIREVNQLLTTDGQFAVDTSADAPKSLTTELRLLALIRLGITDNQKIADILRSSITTIYTYRSKLKARALSKDSFEDDVKHIATC